MEFRQKLAIINITVTGRLFVHVNTNKVVIKILQGSVVTQTVLRGLSCRLTDIQLLI